MAEAETPADFISTPSTMIVTPPDEPEEASRKGMRAEMGSWSKMGSLRRLFAVTLTVSRLAAGSVEMPVSAATDTSCVRDSLVRVTLKLLMSALRLSGMVCDAKPRYAEMMMTTLHVEGAAA
jgi:hypothetical protein